MSPELDDIAEILIAINGTILLLISIVFLRVYLRYRKRNYLLLTLIVFSCALQMMFSEIDILSLPAAIFGFIMILLILGIILFPEKLPFDLEEPFFPESMEITPEDD
ncbi:MAG: hypothetical protein ACFFDT_29445 [Candidatus Hodarchaeota archaeon]